MFEEIIEERKEEKEEKIIEQPTETLKEDLRELTNSEIAYICLNLAKGCEKQYMPEQQKLFNDIAELYLGKEQIIEGNISDIKKLIEEDKTILEDSMNTANKYNDRGAKRVINWASKTTNIVKTILERYEKEGTDFVQKSKIWVCDICGFIYIGEEPPKACPVCKVPSFKILEVK